MLRQNQLSANLDPADRSGLIAWNSFFLAHLEPLATLAWYLVVDGMVVETVVLKSVTDLAHAPFRPDRPIDAYNKAREAIIAQSLPRVAACGRTSRAIRKAQETAPFPDFSRLETTLQQMLEECLADVEGNRIPA